MRPYVQFLALTEERRKEVKRLPWAILRLSQKTKQNNKANRKTGSAAKSIGHSSRGPSFDSQHPHGASQPSVTPVPGN